MSAEPYTIPDDIPFSLEHCKLGEYDIIETYEDTSRKRIGIARVVPEVQFFIDGLKSEKRWCVDCIKANKRYNPHKSINYRTEFFTDIKDKKRYVKLIVWQYADNKKV
jgi:hypothetical protein